MNNTKDVTAQIHSRAVELARQYGMDFPCHVLRHGDIATIIRMEVPAHMSEHSLRLEIVFNPGTALVSGALYFNAVQDAQQFQKMLQAAIKMVAAYEGVEE